MTYRLLYDALLPDIQEAFPCTFERIPYQTPEVLGTLLQQGDILLCRSTLKVPNLQMHKRTPRLVATASSGSDNFDKIALKKLGIPFFDARGCNAESVADFALCCLAILREMTGALPSPVGIFGVGTVGQTVAKRFAALGIELILFDPPRALQDKRFQSASEAALLQCPLIFLHADLHQQAPYASYHWFNRERLAALPDDAILVNLARGALVDEIALLAEVPRIAFISDVFEHEPNIASDMVAKALFCTPHIAGHSLEGKRQAVRILSQKIHAELALPMPSFAPFAKVQAAAILDESTWQERCLAIYDPRVESTKLKAASAEHLTETFLSLRKAHDFRHNFSCVEDFLEV